MFPVAALPAVMLLLMLCSTHPCLLAITSLTDHVTALLS
jgi:hypothetical protein